MTAAKKSIHPKYLLPKGYLSFSQWSLWKKDPEEYKQRYFYGQEGFTNSGMDFGKIIADALENGTEDPMIQMLIDVLPRYEVMEHPIDVKIKGVPIVGRVDTYSPKGFCFDEYKTGKRTKDGKAPWDIVKVRKHEQLPFYALCLKKKHGSISKKVRLHWIETKEGEDGRELTGHIETFERVIEPWELKRMEDSIVQVAKEISDAYQKVAKSL